MKRGCDFSSMSDVGSSSTNVPLLAGRPGEKTPLLSTAGKGKQRDVETLRVDDEESWAIESLADALALELWEREPGQVLASDDVQGEQTSALVSIFAAHRDSIDLVFPPRSDSSQSTSPERNPRRASAHSTALLLAATLTLLDRSTSLRDPPTRGELGVERAIRARATREKLQLALVDLAVRLLDEPLERDQIHSDDERPGEVEDEAVSVLWTEFKLSKDSDKSACGSLLIQFIIFIIIIVS
jgi:hypothetical protein